MILQIDEDQLLDMNIIRNNSEINLNQENERKNKRQKLKSGFRQKRAHLKIEGEDNLSEIQQMDVIKDKKQKIAQENKVIVDARGSNRVLWDGDGDFEAISDE